jgi:hypothetical protein
MTVQVIVSELLVGIGKSSLTVSAFPSVLANLSLMVVVSEFPSLWAIVFLIVGVIEIVMVSTIALQ